MGAVSIAINDSYATAAQYRSFVDKSDTSDDANILTQLTAVSRFFERQVGQFFNQDAAVVVREFFGEGQPYLRLNQELSPGIASKTGLIIRIDEDDDGDFADETALVNSDLNFLPLNADKEPEAQPWREVWLTSRSALSAFPRNRKVQITAIWGWPSVPGPVTQDTIRLTAIWRGEHPSATARFNELDQVVTESPLAMALVKRFQAAYSKAVVA